MRLTLADGTEPSEGMRVELVGHEELAANERTGRIVVLSDDPTVPDACKVLFDDGVEDVMSYRELRWRDEG